MITHNVLQGSQEWLALRFTAFTASEAPVMMDASSKMSRGELLRLKSTGNEREYSDWVQKKLFDKGHEYEASSRIILEQKLGEELFPVVGTDEETGLLASFDGITMLGDTLYEHKMWNESLAEAVRAGNLPAEYYWQLEQQLFVSKAERVIFVVSDGTEQNYVQYEYRPVPGRVKQLLDGWNQFAEDLKNYEPPAPEPVAVGRAPENLPALRIEVTGMVTASNLDEFKSHALSVIGSINRNLVTDQDFADAEKAVKWCGDVETRLEAAKQHALSQTASIDQLFRALDEISAEARATRLEIDKLVKAQKDSRKQEIMTTAQAALANHVATINKRIAPATLPALNVNFALAMKGKRTITTLQDAADAELAKGKIQANDLAEKILYNLDMLNQAGHEFLFADKSIVALKDPEDLKLLIASRIDAHKKAEAERLEAERERIRKEEAERIEREAQSKAPAVVATAAAAPVAKPAVPDLAEDQDFSGFDSAEPENSVPTLRLGQINDRLAPITLNAEGLAKLGFPHAATDKSAKLYHEHDFPRICITLSKHVTQVCGEYYAAEMA